MFSCRSEGAGRRRALWWRSLPVLLLAGCRASPGPQAWSAAELVRRAESGQAFALLSDLVAAAPHRLSGSPGAEHAIEWAVRTMRRIGLRNVRRQLVMVPRWERGEASLELLDAAGRAEALAVLALGGSVPTPPEGILAEVLVVRSFAELRERPGRAAGKIVLFDRPMPRGLANTFLAYREAVPQRTQGAVEAARAGAVAALVRSVTTRLDDCPHTGAMRYVEGVPRIPAAAVSTLAAERLASLAARGEHVRVRLRLGCRPLPDVLQANVIGEIEGSAAPDEVVLLGAHLDAWDVGQGAHDDGAGCVHVLEAARLLLESGMRPRRTLRVVLYINEENGSRGARAYAEAARREGVKHVAALESDRGGFAPVGFTTTAEGARLQRLREAVEPLRALGMGALVRGGGGADIAYLRPLGAELFGLLVVSERYFDYHHSARDVLAAVDPSELARGAAAVAWMAWALAGTAGPRT